MKPGMQRDILVAFWLLFDEFEIGADDPPPASKGSVAPPVPAAAKDTDKAKPRNNHGKNRRHS